MIMSLVCVAHFIFIANDKPTSQKRMKNTSVMLIETLSLHTVGNCAVLNKKKKSLSLRGSCDATSSNNHLQKKISGRHNFKIMADIFFIHCWPTSYCTEVISYGLRAAPFRRLITGTKKAMASLSLK